MLYRWFEIKPKAPKVTSVCRNIQQKCSIEAKRQKSGVKSQEFFSSLDNLACSAFVVALPGKIF
jgi:hypothetical protein